MNSLLKFRFALAWGLPVWVAWAAGVAPELALWAVLGYQAALALLERWPGFQHSPEVMTQTAWHRWCVRAHVPLQVGLQAWGLWLVVQTGASGLSLMAVLALGLGVGGVSGSQGITFAHELGHAKSRLDRFLAWLLMGSVCYAHFMVEHYRGHHPRAATWDDPASARRGESLWRFLPRTLVGSLVSAWRLEAQRLRQWRKPWHHSTLLLATVLQGVWLLTLLFWLGPLALVYWLAQSAYAVFLLEAVNYIEHYGLQRQQQGSRPEPFGVMHAWNADHLLTNCTVANLQRHSDHHMHAWKPYPELEALPGPQLPTGYAGCLFLALVPPLWFAAMHPRLERLPARA